MKPKKKYGQHFLINEGITQKTVDYILQHIPPSGCVLEVGPGKGVLTKHLVDKIPNYKVVEIDEDMVAELNHSLPELKEEQIIKRDILKIDVSLLFDNAPFSLVGNFPYNISSQLLILMFEHVDRIPSMIGMFQKEVADRVVAPPGSKTYGILSVLLQSFYDCKKLFNVSKGSFFPPPKVESAVILLKRNEEKTIPCSKKMFKQVVKLSFNQRRKMLRNNLKSLTPSKEFLNNELFSRRAEQLSVEEFINVTQMVEKEIKSYELRN